MNQGIAALLGVVVGALLTALTSLCGWWCKRGRFEAAVGFELEKALRTMQEKMRWIKAPPPPGVPPDDIVEIDGNALYLGQEEAFHLDLNFWQSNYRDIVEHLQSAAFIEYSETVDTMRQFEEKFAGMKRAFKGTIGDHKAMAAACYRDLTRLLNSAEKTRGIKRAHKARRRLGS